MVISKEDLALYESDGYLLIKNVFTEQEVTDLTLQYDRIWLDAIQSGEVSQNPAEPLVSLFPPLYQRHMDYELIRSFVLSSKHLDIPRAILGKEVLSVSTTCFYRCPQSPSMRSHQDFYGFGLLGGDSCALWVSLDEVDQENGGLFFISGTHRLGMLNLSEELAFSTPPPEGYEVKQLKMNPGDVVVIHPLVVHGSYSNLSKTRMRRSLFTYFITEDAEKIFVRHNEVMNHRGEVVTIKPNNRHLCTRDQLITQPMWA